MPSLAATELPGHWVTRRPDPADAPAILELVAACDTAVLGHPDIALGDIEVDLSRDLDLHTLVLDGRRAVAWASLHDKVAGRTIADVYVDPSLPPELGDAVAARCWQQQIARAAAVATRRGLASTTLDVGVLGGDVVTENRLRAQGLTPRRTFWRMARPLTADDASPAMAAGVTIRGVEADDLATAYAVHESAFRDHWNPHPRTYDEWLRQLTGHATYDPSLWWLAELEGQVAGVLIATRQMADEDAIYIAILGTLREARGRGVGTSLLRHAFAAGLREGWSVAKLNVDSESTTSATSVYAGAGLAVEFSTQAWMLDVAAG